MKCLFVLSSLAALGLTACDTMTGPIDSSSGLDPLRPPGSGNAAAVSRGPTYSAGKFVRATIDNTAFFKNKPSGNADSDKLLKKGTSMKVISTSGSYVKVELDSGEIGYVPALMVEDPSMASAAPLPGTGEYQVYPPLPSGGFSEPLPIIDPSGLPPDGAIPTIIDPEAPAGAVPPLPSSVPSGDFASPAVPTTPVPPVVQPTLETAPPLPPNSEELDAAKKAQPPAPQPKSE